MKKQVTFNEGFNQIKEFPRIPADEKSTLWISKVEISMFRKEVQAENLLDQARSLVKKTILEMNSQTNTDPDEEEVNKQVDSIMLRGIGDVLVFLSDHGVSLMAPGDEKSKHTEAATSVTTNGEQQVRNMVRHKLVLEQTETFLSKEELENQLNEVMKLSRSEILEFLQQESSKHEESHTYPQSDTVSFNWITESCDYWADLPVEIQDAAADLGYTPEKWDSSQQPEESNRLWDELTKIQKQAAITIGYTQYTWDGIEDPSSTEPQIDQKEVIMMQKIRDLVKIKLGKQHKFRSEQEIEEALDQIIKLPKEKIKAYLEMPPIPRLEPEIETGHIITPTKHDNDGGDKERASPKKQKLIRDLKGVEIESDSESESSSDANANVVSDSSGSDNSDSDNESFTSSDDNASSVDESDETNISPSASTRQGTFIAEEDVFLSNILDGNSEIEDKLIVTNEAPTKESFATEEDEFLVNFLFGDNESDRQTPKDVAPARKVIAPKRRKPTSKLRPPSIKYSSPAKLTTRLTPGGNPKSTEVQCGIQFHPFLHSNRAPCELCVFYLSPEERLMLDANGRHLRVMQTAGGCCRECKVFPRGCNEPPVRLCRKCFFDSHREIFQKFIVEQSILRKSIVEN